MRTLEAQWRRLRAGYTDEDGDLRPEHYRDYDEARADHGIDLADRLENWIERLAAALDTPEPAANTATLDPAQPAPDREPGPPAHPHVY